MIKVAAALVGGFMLFAEAPLAAQTIDLADPRAMEQLRTSNPEHFETIRQILLGLHEQPSRVEGDWLAVTFEAREVELGRPVLAADSTAKQSLRFKLDDTQYRLSVVRSDLEFEVEPQRQTLLP